VFLHSLEMRTGVGAGRSEYVIGTLRVGEDPEVLDEALTDAERICWHLTYDGTRWRFHTEPNVNKIVEDGARTAGARAAGHAEPDNERRGEDGPADAAATASSAADAGCKSRCSGGARNRHWLAHL